MRSKNSLLFVKVFMLSILVGAPFLIKQVFPKNEKEDSFSENLSMIEEPNETEENKDSNSNENPDSNKKEEDKSNKNTNTNTNTNMNSNTNVNDKNDSNEKEDNSTFVQFTKVEDSYFSDALFIGDSRTVGIKEYGKLKEATYFCDTGMSIYNIYSKSISVPGVGKVNLKKLLSTEKYGKIYIMLGINEIGYSLDKSTKKFEEVVQYIRKAQPDAIVIIQANLHVAKEKSDKESIFSNKRIDKYNEKLSGLADNKNIFYLDANSIFDDGKGNLKASYTFDNVHIYAKHYVEWTDYLKEHAIEIEKKEEPKKEENTKEDSNNDEDKEEKA